MATTAAVTFVWLGMVVAISFVEAPLKFRAPGVTVRIGLGIGRLVFRALNTIEAVLAQLVVVRPRLTRRSDAVLAGADPPRSRVHYAYVALEGVKAVALLAGGVLVISA
nr:hypothetical protein [Jiangella sp. DSM 45060]